MVQNTEVLRTKSKKIYIRDLHAETYERQRKEIKGDLNK